MRLALLGILVLLGGVGWWLALGASSGPAPSAPLARDRPDLEAPVLLHSDPAPTPRRVARPAPDDSAPAAGRPLRAPAPRPQRPGDCVLAGLRWLAAHQAADGSWAPDADPRACAAADRPEGAEPAVPRAEDAGLSQHQVGVTSFALLAFLGAGFTHRGDHEFSRVVPRARRWLGAHQEHGFVRTTTHDSWACDHAVATWALWIGYGMTESPVWKQAALQALEALLRLRGPEVWT